MRTERRRGFTLIELLVVVAIIALLVSILMPSLGRARDMAQAAVCANRHKGSVMGWAYYGSDYNGVYMAPWDRPLGQVGNLWPGNSHTWRQQYIYTFLHYANGGGLPSGETVWMAGPGGGWYSEDGRHGQPASLLGWPPVVPQVRCPQIDALGTGANFLWYGTASQSYFQMGRYRTPAGNWAYGSLGYPQPDLMTHPATTGLMMCMTTVPGENRPNVWASYRNDPYDPHMDESNYSFVDGHVERLPQTSTYRYMWLSMWDRSDPDYIDRYIPQTR